MALVALDRLGAPDERLAAFAAAYGSKLEEPGEREAGLKQAAAADLATQDVDTMLRAGLAELASDIAGSAFHEIIHLAYALDEYDAPEIANALAHWRTVRKSLDVPVAGGRDDVGTVLAALAARDDIRAVKVPGLITDQVAAVAAQPGFAEIIGRLSVGPDTVGQIAAAALQAFAATQDFIALHMLTGTHAMRVVTQAADDMTDALIGGFWPVFAGAYVVIGAPTEVVAADADAPDWRALHAAGREHDDEHVIKIIYSCWQESLAYGNDALYRTAAARYLNR